MVKYDLMKLFRGKLLTFSSVASGVFFFCALLFITKTPPNNTILPTITSRTPTLTTVPVKKEPLPLSKTLHNEYHIFQTFNNCGPASLSMALSYYNIHITQEILGQNLRPYQNPQGDNDDKSVTLNELAEEAKKYDLIPYHRPHGNIETLKAFIANDMPIITRTWLHENEDIGHYRVVKGYDDSTHELIQDDSFQNKNLRFSYDSFNTIWKKFNYEYLVLVPKEKQTIAREILGENVDENIAWRNALTSVQEELKRNPDDVYARFNLVVTAYHTGDYTRATQEYEKIQTRLPSRTLWYQIEPIQAYAAINNTERVFSLTDKILQNGNRAFSELYLIRGDIYKKQGDLVSAQREYENAYAYNKSMEEANEKYTQIDTARE